MFDQPPPNLPTLGTEPTPLKPAVPPSATPEPAPMNPPAREPDDMFAGVEPASTQAPAGSPTSSPLGSSSMPTIPQEYLEETHPFHWKKIIIAIVVVVGIGGLAYAGYVMKDQLFGGSETTDTTDLNVEDTTNTTPSVDTTDTTVTTPVPDTTEPTPDTTTLPDDTTVVEPSGPDPLSDEDSDGLSAAQEADLGTDPSRTDTDGDQLYDGEEVNLFHTNPTLSDTDGDTYLDGAEVKSGYNPNGPGKLFEVNQQ